jgi:hypothetical protein
MVVEIIARQLPSLKSYNEANGTAAYTSAFVPTYESKYYTHYKNEDVRIDKMEFTQVQSYNSLGFSDVDFIKKKNSKEFRILCLGDSFTQGMGASAQNMAWPKQLETLLNQGDDTLQYTVYNAGLSGCDPYYSYKIYEELLAEYEFDHIVLLINQSDIDDFLYRGGFSRFKENGKVEYNKAPAIESLFARSFSLRLVLKALGYNHLFIKNKEMPQQVAVANDSLYSLCIQFEKLCNSRQHSFTVLSIPMIENFSGFQNQLALIEENLQKSPIHSLVFENFLRENIRSNDSIKNLYWPIDRHFTDKGYALLATYIKENLQQ